MCVELQTEEETTGIPGIGVGEGEVAWESTLNHKRSSIPVFRTDKRDRRSGYKVKRSGGVGWKFGGTVLFVNGRWPREWTVRVCGQSYGRTSRRGQC